MPNQLASLDSVFQALSNPTRRGVVDRLCLGPAGMTELAGPYAMALPSFLQHLQVLERSGLVGSRKTGRTRVFHLRPQALVEAEHWLEAHRRQWTARLDRLDGFLAQNKDTQP